MDTTDSVSRGHSLLPQLPEKPLIRISCDRNGFSESFRDLWEYRELWYFLTWRDVKIRYKQTLLGIAWAILQPLFAMILFTIFFGRLAGVPSDGLPYAAFAYAGLLPWTFVSNTVTACGNSLVGSSHLITKIYFPRMIIPGAAVGVGLVDLCVAFPFLAILLAYFRLAPSWSLLMVPVLLLFLSLLTLGVGMWMAALNVKYRDVRFALPFLVQIWLFVTPVIYPSSLVPEGWRWLLKLNPLTGFVEGFRSSLLGRPFDWQAIGISAFLTLVIVIYASRSFRRMERSFADII